MPYKNDYERGSNIDMIQGAEALWKALRGKITALIKTETSNDLKVARYTVTTKPNGSVIGVTLPLGNKEISIPYSHELDDAEVGDIVTVMWYNTLSNAKAVWYGDGYNGREKPPIAYSNPNLLDNPWFNSGNVVNQRGVTSFTVGSYGVDRWKLVSGSASVGANGITLNGTLRQIRENALGTSDFKASVICASGTATASYNDSTKYFDIVSSGGVIKCAKLELGSVSNLANDTAPNYALELAKCQRYAVKFTGGASQRINSGQTTSSLIDFIIPLPMPLYISPSIESGSFNVYKFTSSGSATVAGLTPAIIGSSGDSPFVGIRFTGSGLTATDRYFLNMTNVILSADL